MFRKLLSAKIHRATVTEANLDYEGSITLPPALLEASGIVPFESVHVWNVTSGHRFETYAMAGDSPNGICINGAAAHRARVGDLVIIATFCFCTEEQTKSHQPRVVFVGPDNSIREIRAEKVGMQNPVEA